MVRMYYNEKDLFNDTDVKRDLITDDMYIDSSHSQLYPEITMLAEKLAKELIIFEFKISKSKEGNKDKKSYLLVSKRNLRFYNNLDEYLKDRDALNRNSSAIMNELQRLVGLINIGGDLPDIDDDLMEVIN